MLTALLLESSRRSRARAAARRSFVQRNELAWIAYLMFFIGVFLGVVLGNTIW